MKEYNNFIEKITPFQKALYKAIFKEVKRLLLNKENYASECNLTEVEKHIKFSKGKECKYDSIRFLIMSFLSTRTNDILCDAAVGESVGILNTSADMALHKMLVTLKAVRKAQFPLTDPDFKKFFLS